MQRYRLEPEAEISTTVMGGEELRLEFDSKGFLEVRDDFQEANKALLDNPQVRLVREKG